MSTPGPGQHGQPDDPQCYNCGTVGHWAVACPEPTRETPAGLAAWRNSSTPNQTNPKGQGPGSSKRSKGPIITKYGPPPPPPPPSFAQGMNHMPPPPPPPPAHHHHPHPPTSYPGPALPYQTYAPPPPPPPASAPAPAPAYSGNFPSTAYGYSHPPPPHHHSHPHPHPPYQPPPPHGAPHFGPPGYMGPPPTLGPPPGGHYPANRGDGLENRPSPHSQAFSRSPPPPKSSPPMSATPPQSRSGSRQTSGLAKPPSLPPKPPVGVASHPLPPKPPKSHDQSSQQHDHRNKRKNDRHNKGRDRRQSNDHHNQRHPNPGPHQHGHLNHSPENRRSSGSRKGQRQHHGNMGSKNHNPHASSPDQQVAGSKGTNNGRRASKDQGHRRSSSENVPRHRDDSGSAAKKTNMPFGANGSVSSVGIEKVEKTSPKLNSSQARGEMSDGPERRSSADHRGISIKHSQDHDDPNFYGRQPKRPKIDASPRTETKMSKSDEEEECIWDTIDVPREADRRQQQAERDHAGAKRRGSTASRASSQTSQSSDLNSLEAELLGRPVKQRPSEKSSTRHRPEHQDRFKPKRRPVNTNSAYSRRW